MIGVVRKRPPQRTGDNRVARPKAIEPKVETIEERLARLEAMLNEIGAAAAETVVGEPDGIAAERRST